MSGGAHIIIVEDNLPLARSVARLLAAEGHTTALARNGAEMRRLYREQAADLVLLDLNLGAEDGLDLARELVRTSPVAVIIMTGRDEVQDRIRGLDAGADDYLTKPFAVGELSARVRAVLRRRAQGPRSPAGLRFGPVELDPDSRALRCDGVETPLQLTEAQSLLLERLIRAGGRPVGRPELMLHGTWQPGDRTADVHIGHIRRRLAEVGFTSVEILSVRGHGYRLVQLGEK